MTRLICLLSVCLAWGPFASPALATDEGPGREGEGAAIRNLIETLGSESWGERNAAAVRLGRMGPPAFEALHRASLSHTDPEVRHQARLLLPSILWKGMPPGLAEKFRGYFQMKPELRAFLLDELPHRLPSLGASRVRNYLERAYLYDPSPLVRECALEGMVESGVALGVGVLGRLAEIRPDPEARKPLGIAFAFGGFPDEALERLLPAGPVELGDDLEALTAVTRALAETGRIAEAVPYARMALDLGGRDFQWNPLPAVRVLLEAGKAQEALDDFPWESAVQEYRAGFAAELSARGLHDIAADFLDEALFINESILLSRILARTGKKEEALAKLGRSIETNDPDGVGVLVQARGLAHRGLRAEVLERFAKLGEEETPPSVMLERARWLIEAGRADEAEPLLLSKTAAKAFEGEADAGLPGIAELLLRMGKGEKLKGLLERTLPGRHWEPPLLETLGQDLERAGLEEDAVNLYVDLLPRLYDRNDHRRVVDRILFLARKQGTGKGLDKRLERRAEVLADRWLKRMIRLADWFRDDRDQVPVLTLLGRLRAVRGRFREARALLNRAWELAPPNLEWLVLSERVEVERRIGDDLSKAFFRILLTPAGGDPMEPEEGFAHDLAFLRFSIPFCNPRWVEGIGPRVGSGGAEAFTPPGSGFLPVPFPGVPMDAPFVPVFARWLWKMSRSAPAEDGDSPPFDILRRALQAAADLEGEKAWTAVAGMVRRGGLSLRRVALGQIEAFPSAPAVPFLVREMKASVGDFPWQVELAKVLSTSPLGPHRGEIESLKTDPSGRVRALSAFILLRKGEGAHAEVLERIALDEGEPLEARRFAATALAPLAEEGRRLLFRRLVASPEAGLRLSGAQGLHALGDPEGVAVVRRELLWHLEEESRWGFSDALETAATLGGKELARVLVNGVNDPDISTPEVIETLIRIGAPGRRNAMRMLDNFPFAEVRSGGRLGRFLDILTDGEEVVVCREALFCLLEDFPPGGMSGIDVARAARLARRAGREATAERFFRLARHRLAFRSGDREREAFVLLLCDFGRELDFALEEARALRRLLGPSDHGVFLEAKALSASGKKKEALALLEEALAGFPGRERARLVSLRERVKKE